MIQIFKILSRVAYRLIMAFHYYAGKMFFTYQLEESAQIWRVQTVSAPPYKVHFNLE